MTRYSFFVFGICLAALSWHLACKNSTDPLGPSPSVTAGEWKVSYYFDRSDKTTAYAGYTFDFKIGGGLLARSSTQSWNGTWSTTCDDSAPKLCLSFDPSAPSLLRELAEDWLILSISDSLMRLEHRSGGGGDTEVLHFTRL